MKVLVVLVACLVVEPILSDMSGTRQLGRKFEALIPKNTNTELEERIRSAATMQAILSQIANVALSADSPLLSFADSVVTRIGSSEVPPGVRQTISAVLDSLPQIVRDFIRTKFVTSINGNPLLAALVVPLSPSKDLSAEEISVIDAFWNVADSALLLVMNNTEAEQQMVEAFNAPVATQPCNMLQALDRLMFSVAETISNANSVSEVIAAVQRLKTAPVKFDISDVGDQLKCMSPSDPSHASVLHILAQVSALPHSGAFLKSLLATGADENLSQVPLPPELQPHYTSFLETSSRFVFRGMHISAHILLLILCTLSFAMYYRVYIQRIYTLETLLGNHIVNASQRPLDEIVVLVALGVMMVGSTGAAWMGMLYHSGLRQDRLSFFAKLGAEVKRLQMLGSLRKAAEAVESALRKSGNDPNDRFTRMTIIELCRVMRRTDDSCAPYQHFTSRNFQKLQASLRQLKSDSQDQSQTASDELSADDMKALDMFQQFFQTASDRVTTEQAVTKLMATGIPDDQSRSLIATADKQLTGYFTFKDFRKYLLEPEPINYTLVLLSHTELLPAFVIFIAALVGIFAYGDPRNTQFGLNITLAFGLVVGCELLRAQGSSATLDAKARLLRDKRINVSLDAVFRSSFLILTMTIVYLVILKTCDAPALSCPTDAAMDPIVFPLALRDYCLANGTDPICAQYATSSLQQCVDDISGSVIATDASSCSSNAVCTASQSSMWKTSESSPANVLSYALAWYNSQANSNVSQSDFISVGSMTAEFNRESVAVPPATVICVDEPSNAIKQTSNVARGRYSNVETLLDYGVNVTTKFVAFVYYGQACTTLPASTIGTNVRPFDIGNASEDFASFAYSGRNLRRFAYPVPDPVTGRNFYTMCERTATTGPWTQVDAVYVFGVQAVCGAPDCSNSDFSSKMQNDIVSKLYYAVICSTTIGFGDIVPISNRARLSMILSSMMAMLLAYLW